MIRFDLLPPDLRDSLAQWILDNGDEWRIRLQTEWMRGNPLDRYPGLYRARNTYGSEILR